MIQWKFILWVFVAVLVLTTKPGAAEIVVNVDLSTQEFYFSGSDSGSLLDAGWRPPDGYANWNNGGGGGQFTINISNDLIWSGSGSAAIDSQLTLGSPGVGINIFIEGGGTSSGTLSFHGNRFSYLAATTFQRQQIEDLAINDRVLNPSASGTGFSAIRFTDVSSVPEPTGIWITPIIGMLVAARRRNLHSFS